jgi:predicted acylesterase/phospholipase RssA
MSSSSEPYNITWRPDGTGPAIGLCLSGGGFRAALFSMGVMRYLAEAGQLGNVRGVSAVSGGSVAAAAAADRWPELAAGGFTVDTFDKHVSGPFLDVVTGKNLRNRGVARWALTRVAPKRRRLGSSLGVTMVKHLLRAQRVAELPDGLQMVLTSTDLRPGISDLAELHRGLGVRLRLHASDPLALAGHRRLDGGAVPLPARARAHRRAGTR